MTLHTEQNGPDRAITSSIEADYFTTCQHEKPASFSLINEGHVVLLHSVYSYI